MRLELAQTCTRCNLHRTRRNIVWGEGSVPAPIAFVAQNPGKQEDRMGRPFVDYAKAGREYNQLLRKIHLARDKIYTTNLVKCHCPKDRDPLPGEITTCTRWLEMEMDQVKPRIIGAVGKPSTQFFLDEDVDMEKVHGLPFPFELPSGEPSIVVPLFHPASGLHQTRNFTFIWNDFQAIGEMLRGQRSTERVVDIYEGKEEYDDWKD